MAKDKTTAPAGVNVQPPESETNKYLDMRCARKTSSFSFGFYERQKAMGLLPAFAGNKKPTAPSKASSRTSARLRVPGVTRALK
jgi:hypothetical protein